MKESPYGLSVLPNGVRVASVTMPHLRGVTVGVWAAVGGRHEEEAECGLAHFVEHLLFKGTSRRTALELSCAVEGVGGYLNAFTTEDHTCFYAKAAARHFDRLCDVLLEMYTDARFPSREVQREREVIREEILSFRDSPAQWAEDLLSEAMWPGHPLGRPLTGTEESILKLGAGEIRGFRDRFYTGRNTIFTVAGPLSHEEVMREVGARLGRIPEGGLVRTLRVSKRRKSRIRVEEDGSEQAHLGVGFHGVSRTDPGRYAFRLLSVILGENMSSRLFQALRERAGLCYSVQSSTVLLEETGALSVFADLDPAKMPGAVRLLRREMERLAERRPSARELRRAKDYAIGQTQISLDSGTQQIAWMAESLMAFGRIFEFGEVEAGFEGVGAEEVCAQAAGCWRAGRVGVALVGPGFGVGEMERLFFS